MKQKEISDVTKIRYGEVHAYFPIKFSTDLSYKNIHSLVSNNSIIFSSKYYEKKLSELELAATSIANELNTIPDAPHIFKVPNIYCSYNSYNNTNISSKDLLLELCATGTSFNINLHDKELDILVSRIQFLNYEYEKSHQIYGAEYSNAQDRFILLPLKVTLTNNEDVWLLPILYLFTNKTGILKLELPLLDIDTVPLKSNSIEEYIQNISCSWNKSFKSKDLNSIRSLYLSKLIKENGIGYFCDASINNIILIDYDGIPSHINKIDSKTQEELYRIVSAPVSENSPSSYKSDASNYINNNTYGTHNIKYIIKSTGGCLSIIDYPMLKKYFSDYNVDLNIYSDNKIEYIKLCSELARQININAEYVLIIILLEKINCINHFIEKELKLKELSSKDLINIQNEYWNDVVYINNLQQNCYGTVYEQLETFKSKMCHYIKPNLTKEKIIASDNILKNNKSQSKELFQKHVTFISTFFAIIFGLPSIYETLGILRKYCDFITFDVPILTHLNTSIILWLVLILVIFKILKYSNQQYSNNTRQKKTFKTKKQFGL